MRNNNSIIDLTDNVKHANNLRIVRREDYKDIAGMSTSAPKAKNEHAPKRKRTVQPSLGDLELARFERVAARYQRIAGVKNPNIRCNIENTELVYGALIALERTVSDEDFYKCIIDGLGACRNKRATSKKKWEYSAKA
jgi:hypothetical protein